jgi:hypothetical protein
MQARDPYFDQAVLDGANVRVRCDVLRNGVPVGTIPLTAGSVKADRGQRIRRSCDVTVADESLIPADATGLLAPYGAELRLWRGVELPDGRDGLVPVGTFVIWTATSASPFGGLKIVAYDRMKLVEQAGFLYPRSFPEGSLLARIRQLITEAVPTATIMVDEAVTDAYVGPATYDAGSSQRVDVLAKAATALGAELFCDPMGIFVLQPIPDPYGPVDWQMFSGVGLVSVARSMSREGVYNVVVAQGQSTGTAPAPISQPASDDDEWSPTYAGGVSKLTGQTFGQATYSYSSPLLRSDEQANLAARSLLRDVVGQQKTVQITGLVQPALEPGDVIGLDGTEQHLVESFNLDLSPAASGMTVQTRSTRYAAS